MKVFSHELLIAQYIQFKLVINNIICFNELNAQISNFIKKLFNYGEN